MARWINNKASSLGLQWGGPTEEGKTPKEPRTVAPGQVFDAEESEIPEQYRKLNWIAPAEGMELTAVGEVGIPDQPIEDDATKGVPDQPARPRQSKRPAAGTEATAATAPTTPTAEGESHEGRHRRRTET